MLRSLYRWFLSLPGSFLRRSFLRRFLRRSFKTHASLPVTDLNVSKDFYTSLGFREVTSTRAKEVVLLRNHRGDELNLVPSNTVTASAGQAGFVSFEAGDLEHEFNRLRNEHGNLEIKQDSSTRYFRLTDPDLHVVELYKKIEKSQRLKVSVFHVATRSELAQGLSRDYYMPPEGDYRFVRCRPYSAYVGFACARVAREVGADPLVIELDQGKLSIEEEWLGSDIDNPQPAQKSTFAHVLRPIPSQAIIRIGEPLEESPGNYTWPKRFEDWASPD